MDTQSGELTVTDIHNRDRQRQEQTHPGRLAGRPHYGQRERETERERVREREVVRKND